MTAKFTQRFEELCNRADEILAARTHTPGAMGGTNVDQNDLIKWQVSSRHLLSMVCGPTSEHFQAFEDNQKAKYVGDSNYAILLRQRAVFMAAQEDYEGGYLTRLRDLIQAEVFESELDQAQELFRAQYSTAAAVIAGTVLETTLRQMCHDRGIDPGKMDKMNADLSKAGAYNSLVQKRITALAAVRNSAAHGKNSEFSADDVSSMIRDVERFAAVKGL